jgi:ferredoxin-thioredoxin reductase catalytic chain
MLGFTMFLTTTAGAVPYGRYYETSTFRNGPSVMPPPLRERSLRSRSHRSPFPPSAVTVSDSSPSSSPAAQGPNSLEVIRRFAETYAQRTGTYFCSDLGVTAVVLEGLARHKDELGGALCPCRHYEDKAAEVSQAFWNCPCVPMRERKECHCMLFLTEDNPFRGEQQTISIDEIKAYAAG